MYHYNDNPEKTKWHNPTDKPVTVEVFLQTPRALNEHGADDFRLPSDWRDRRQREMRECRKRYVWQPGETLELDSYLDRAIHTQDRNGMIIGGQAPQLVRVGADRNIHPSLDAEKVQKTVEFEALTQAMMAKKVAEQAVEIAAQQASASNKRSAK